MIDTLTAFETTTLIAFLGASIALYLTPGSDMMFIAASGAAGSPRAGVAAALGVSLGSLSHTVLAVAGVAALIATHPLAFDALRYSGAAYLVYLAVQTWRAAPMGGDATGAATTLRAFRRGALTNLLNPKVSLFVLAFLPQFTDPAIGPVWIQIALLGTLFSLASIPFNIGYGALAGHLAGGLRRVGGLINKITALIFGGLAVRLIAT